MTTRFNGNPVDGINWSPRAPDLRSPAMHCCPHCGRKSHAALMRNLDLRQEEADDLGRFVIEWLETEFKRKDTGPREIVLAFSRAVQSLQLIETAEGGYPEIRPWREVLVPPELQEAACHLFNRSAREIIRRTLDGRLSADEGTEGWKALNEIVRVWGEDRLGAEMDRLAKGMPRAIEVDDLVEIDIELPEPKP